MRRSQSIKPKVEGLESLIFLSHAAPVQAAMVPEEVGTVSTPEVPTDAAAEAETVVITSEPGSEGDVVTTISLPPGETTGTHDPAAQNGAGPDRASPGRPHPGLTARPNGPEVVRPVAEHEAVPISAPTFRGGARPTPPARPVGGPAINLESLDLSSTMRGNYRLQIAPDGSSGSFQLQGSGQVRGLGPARIATHYTADTSSAPETMTVSIETRRGALTLQVGRGVGDVDPDPSTARLRYEVVDATGALAGARGSGVLHMTLRPQMRTMGASGQMTMTLHPDLA